MMWEEGHVAENGKIAGGWWHDKGKSQDTIRVRMYKVSIIQCAGGMQALNKGHLDVHTF